MPHVLAQDLRNAVLQSAMSGKLTNQSSEDTSVIETLRNIRKDREDRVSNKEVKKDKRLSDVNISDLRFDIPDNWKWTVLGAILYKLTDGTHKTPKYTTSGVKFVSVKDMSTGILCLDNTKFISEEEHDELFARCNPQRGDIILSKVGTTGVPAIVNTDEAFSLFVSVALLKFNDKLINREFLYYLLKSPDVQQQAAENTRGIGNKNWVLDAISVTEIPLPPIEEQARIVARIDELMAKIDEYEKIEKELNELQKAFPDNMKDAILQAAMQGKLTEQLESDTKAKLTKITKPLDEDIPFDLPETWDWCTLQDIAKVYGGYAFKSTEYINTGVRVVRISDFNENGFVNNSIVRYKYDEKLDSYLLKDNDILMCMTGGTVGKTYCTKKLNEKMYLNQRVAAIRNNGININYLRYYIHSPFVKDIIDRKKNSTNDNISMVTINTFPFPLPPIEEQQRIVDKLDQLLPLCESLEAMI